MTKEEFEEVLILTDISNPTSEKKTAYGTTEQMYTFENFTLYFNGKNRVIIEGKIPLEVAKIIDSNYDMAYYGIYYEVNSYSADNIEKHIVDDKFFERLSSYVKRHPDENMHSLINKSKDEQRSVLKRNTEKYIKNYYILTKEGLFIFINEMKKYFVKKNNGSIDDIKYFDNEIKLYIDGYQRTK